MALLSLTLGLLLTGCGGNKPQEVGQAGEALQGVGQPEEGNAPVDLPALPGEEPELPETEVTGGSPEGPQLAAMENTPDLRTDPGQLEPAPPSTGQTAGGSTTSGPVTPEAWKMANALTVIGKGGHATEADRQAVARELARLPEAQLHALWARNTRIAVAQDSVTDVRTDLAGVTPRGWKKGQTWDQVPGLWDPQGNRVIIATRNGSVPVMGNGHGSVNLVAHETGHAVDAVTGGHSNAGFQQARTRVLPTLSDYERQAGNAGLEESYAESLARYINNPGGTDALSAWWSTSPVQDPYARRTATPRTTRR